jgi:hypothetical protein
MFPCTGAGEEGQHKVIAQYWEKEEAFIQSRLHPCICQMFTKSHYFKHLYRFWEISSPLNFPWSSLLIWWYNM